MRIASWVLRILLACLFFAAGGMKLAAMPEAVETFDRLGLGQWFRVAIGVAEVAGAVGLLLTPLAPVAALALAAVMVGAVISHLVVLGASDVGPALVALALCLVVAWLERGGFHALGVLFSGKGAMDGWMARAYDRGVQKAFRDLFPVLAKDILASLRGARRVLDAGCGPGQFTILGAESLPGAEVWGIDLAPAMIDLARARAAQSSAAGRLHFQVADVARLPFPDGHFDALLSSGSIKHWPDPQAGLSELHRVFAPGGRAFIAEMNRTAPREAVAAVAARTGNWFAQRMYPRALASGLSPAEARQVFGASPFGQPTDERLLLDGCLWVFELRKGGVSA